MRMLAIDTSTEACSAAVLRPDGRIALRHVLTERGHAELVLPMIDDVLGEAGRHARSVAGAVALPYGAAVSVESILRVG